MTIPIRFKRGPKANLPSAAPAGEPLFTLDTHELFIGTGDSVVPIAGVDPALTERIDELELHRSTVSNTYSEDFHSLEHVDSEKTSAGVIGGRVMPTVTPTFTEDFSNLNYFDQVNSLGVTIDTARGLLKNSAGTRNGIFWAKQITIPSTDKITVNAVVNEPSTYGFSEGARFSYAGSIFSQPMGFADRTNRTWKVALVNGAGIYAKVTNPDGSLSFEGIVLPFTGEAHTMPFQSIDYAVDHNNRVWFGISLATSVRGMVGAVNSDGSTFMNWYNIYSGSYTTTAITLTVDKQNRIWVFHSVYTYTRLHVFNGDGTLCKDLTNILTSGTTTYLQAVFDPLRDQVVLAIRNNWDVHIVLFDSSFNVIRTEIITRGAGYNTPIALSYDPVLDKYIFVQVLTTNKTGTSPVKISSLDPETLNGSENIVDLNTNWVSRLVADGSLYHFICSSGVELNKYYLTTFQASDLSLVDTSVVVSTQTGKHYPFKDSNGVLRSLALTNRYDAKQAVDEYTFSATKATVKIEVTNNNGLDWVPCLPGKEVTFPTPSTSLILRARLDSPTATLSPELYGYQVITGSLTGEVQQEFVSTKLPSVSPIAHASLTVDQTLHDGTIDWYLSNNGGATWEPAILGEKHTFQNPLFADLRVKAVITTPAGAVKPPAISGYTITSSNLLLNPVLSDPTMPQRLIDLEVNLLKTNFKLSAYMSAWKYNYKNVVIDTFTDFSGIDLQKSSNTLTIVNGSVTFSGGKLLLNEGTGGTPESPIYTASNGVKVIPAGGVYANSNYYLVRYLFNGKQTGDADTYFLAASSVPANSPVLTFDFTSSGTKMFDLKSMKVFPLATSNPNRRGISGKVQVTLNGTDWIDVGSFDHSEKNSPSQFDSILIQQTGVQQVRLIKTSNINFDALAEIEFYLLNSEKYHVVSLPEKLPTMPTRFLMEAEYTANAGSVSFEVSRDNGIHFTAVTPGKELNLAGLPEGTDLVLRATLTNNAELHAWGYMWL